MSNKYPGYCVTCQRRVGAGHGSLERSGSGAYVVRCSGSSKGAATATAAKPKAPKHAGVTSGEGVVSLSYARLGERDATKLVGQAYRVPPKDRAAGALAGQMVFCVGAETYYQSDEDNDDMGDMQGGGWGATRYVRLATPEEAAPALAAEAERKAERDRVLAAADAKKAKEKADHDAYAKLRDEVTAGLIRTDTSPPSQGQGTERLGHDDRLSLERRTDDKGRSFIIEWGTVAIDMDISTRWGTAEQVAEWRLQWAKDCKITRAGAAGWLEKYSGCQGADDYRALLTLLPVESVS